MRRAEIAVAFIAILLFAFVILWRGAGRDRNHVVDGQTLGPESTACPLFAFDCDIAVAAAMPVLKTQDPGAIVTATSFAQPPCPDGTIPCTFAGIGRLLFVVFDLEGGSRRAIRLMCAMPTYEGQSLVRPAACESSDTADSAGADRNDHLNMLTCSTPIGRSRAPGRRIGPDLRGC
jgi:hypothetical protein